MSVLDHHQTNVQVWDGRAFDYVPPSEAKKLVKAGTHQISTGITAAQLKRPDEFKSVEVELPPVSPKPKRAPAKSRNAKAKYDNKQMTSEND